MPVYVYKCEKCSHEFEQTRKMSDPNPPCPKVVLAPEEGPPQPESLCDGPTTKLIVGGTFHLKGSGWASDGYTG